MPSFNLRLADDLHRQLQAAQKAREERSLQSLIVSILRTSLLPPSVAQDQDYGSVASVAAPPRVVIHLPGTLGGEKTGGPWTIVEPLSKLEAKYYGCGRDVCWKTFDYELHRVRSAGSRGWAQRLEGADLMASLLMNSRLADSEGAALMDNASAIEAALLALPDQDLESTDLKTIERALIALFASVRVPGVSIAKSTKLLAMKRPRLLPILDSRVLEALYGRSFPFSEDPTAFGHEVVDVLRRFKALMVWKDQDFDNLATLRFVCNELERLLRIQVQKRGLDIQAMCVSAARALEQLLWFDFWGHDYYGYSYLERERIVRADAGRPTRLLGAPWREDE